MKFWRIVRCFINRWRGRSDGEKYGVVLLGFGEYFGLVERSR